MKNSVYIGVSLDGFIADREGKLDFLDAIPAPEGEDMGFFGFMDKVDALVMGRNTFETVCGFDVDWPYQKHVFVLSNTLTSIPEKAEGKASIINGSLQEVVAKIHARGYQNLYIDGGRTIQNFLKERLIDEMIITTIPILIGGGTSLFGALDNLLLFKCVDTKLFENGVVQNHFVSLK